MKELLAVLQGAVAVAGGCTAAGFLVLGGCGARLHRFERWGLAFAVGAPVYSLLLMALMYGGQMRRGNVTLLAGVLIAGAYWRRHRLEAAESAQGPAAWGALMAAGSLLFGVVWLLNAAAPDTTLPGASPALEQAAALSQGNPLAPGERWSAALPLWAAAFTVGRHAACSTLHVCCLYALTSLVFGAMRRWLGPAAAAVAGLLIITNPGLGAVAADAGTEVLFVLQAGACIAFALLAWRDRQDRLWWAMAPCAMMAALLAGEPQGEWFRGFLFEYAGGPWIVVPLLAVAGGWLLRDNRASALLVVTFAGLTSWPPMARALAPREKRVGMMANPELTLRRLPPEQWLIGQLPGYVEAKFLDEQTPAGALIVLDAKVARAWTRRRVLPAPGSGELPRAAFDAAVIPDREERISVATEERTSFALDNTARVAEAQFYMKGQPLPRSRLWRVRCSEAFDNSAVTSCSGAIEVRFGAPVTFDEVRLLGKRGKPVRPPRGLREAVWVEWKRQGVTHILAESNGELYDELSRNGRYWHVTQMGERNGSHLFRVE